MYIMLASRFLLKVLYKSEVGLSLTVWFLLYIQKSAAGIKEC